MIDGRDCTAAAGCSVIGGSGRLAFMASLTEMLVATGMAHGATAVGACDASVFGPDRDAMAVQVASGRSGRLHFTYTDPTVATDVTRTFPWARSLVVVAVDYLSSSLGPAPTGAVVARFATSVHYRLLDTPLEAISSVLTDSGHRVERLVDDNRLLDRAAAVRSGIGWRGKSTMVLGPGRGPWTLLGSIVTDAALEPSRPMARDCGTCTACLPACPTSALDGESLDARRCLAAWLQTPGTLPHWIRAVIGRRIYGCDDCLTSCPPGGPALRSRGQDVLELPFEGLLALSDDDLLNRFSWWYVPGREARHLRRNILVAAGNSREPGALPGIVAHLDHPSALVRGHAAWALARSLSTGAVTKLEERVRVETMPQVKEEALLALLMAEEPERYQEWLAQDEAAIMAQYPDTMASKKEPVTPALRAIRAAGIEYTTHLFDYDRHPGAAGAAEALGVDLHETVKTIVFETSEGDGVMVLMNGDHEVSAKALARHLGVKSVKPASADRARRWTGYEFGGTSPFGTRETIDVWCHKDIVEMGTIYINAGSRGFLVGMPASELIRVLQPEMAPLAVEK